MERYWNPVETAPIHEMKALQEPCVCGRQCGMFMQHVAFLSEKI